MERRIVAQFLTCMDGMDFVPEDAYTDSYNQFQSCLGKRQTISQSWLSEQQTVQTRWIPLSAAQAASTMR